MTLGEVQGEKKSFFRKSAVILATLLGVLGAVASVYLVVEREKGHDKTAGTVVPGAGVGVPVPGEIRKPAEKPLPKSDGGQVAVGQQPENVPKEALISPIFPQDSQGPKIFDIPAGSPLPRDAGVATSASKPQGAVDTVTPDQKGLPVESSAAPGGAVPAQVDAPVAMVQPEVVLPGSPPSGTVITPSPGGHEGFGQVDQADPTLRPAVRLHPEETKPEKKEDLDTGDGTKAEKPDGSGEILYEEDLPTLDHREKMSERISPVIPADRKHAGNRIALVIDDLGYNKPISKAITHLPADLTLAVLPGGDFSREVGELASSLGKELILHQPMQPQGYPGVKPGKGALFSAMPVARIHQILEDNFKSFPHAIGLNNHMGSQLTTERESMDAVMSYLKPRGLIFLDSRTSTQSVAESRALAMGVVATRRDVFIDNIPEKHAVAKKLGELVTFAKNHGRAVGIGHPHQATLDALREWLPTLKEKGVTITRLSHLLPKVSSESASRQSLAPGDSKKSPSREPDPLRMQDRDTPEAGKNEKPLRSTNTQPPLTSGRLKSVAPKDGKMIKIKGAVVQPPRIEVRSRPVVPKGVEHIRPQDADRLPERQRGGRQPSVPEAQSPRVTERSEPDRVDILAPRVTTVAD